MKIKILEKIKLGASYIYDSGLVIQDFGNISVRDQNDVYIKASGKSMSTIDKNDFVMVDLYSKKYKSNLRPSSDTPTHLELYKSFDEIGCIVHTHSIYATSWAQSGKSIPCLGTTHSDFWQDIIPNTRSLNDKEINGNYEIEVGRVIIETIKGLGYSPLSCPGVLVSNHGPFTWGRNITEAIKTAEILEYIAKIAFKTLSINPDARKINQTLINKHFLRKNGEDAYYGQENN